MNSKKPNTKRKHEKIFTDVENLLKNKEVGSVWEACEVVSKRNRMTTPSISVVYYTVRKKKVEENNKQVQK